MQHLRTISNEELAALPLGAFEGQIIVVETEEELREACRYMRTQKLLGFDTETRPTFKAGVTHRVALLQLSTPDRCYLIRLCKVQFDRKLAEILENPAIQKIGAAITDDIRALQKLRRFRQDGFIDLQNIVHEWGIGEKSVRKMTGVVLDIRISKAQRLSNWEAATLTPAQQSYAATDAWACLEIYRRLC